MKKVHFAILFATLYLVIFHLSPYLGISIEVIFLMLVLSPFVVISMAYVILKYGKPSKFTFEQRFYDDWDYQRNIVKQGDLE